MAKDKKIASRRVWSMMFDPNNPNRLLVGTHSSGIYRVDQIPATAANETEDETITRPRVSTTINNN